MANLERKVQKIIGEAEGMFGAEFTAKNIVPFMIKFMKAATKAMDQNKDGTKTYEDGLWIGFQIMNAIVWESFDVAKAASKVNSDDVDQIMGKHREHIRDLCTAEFTRLLLSNESIIDKTYEDGIFTGFQVSQDVAHSYINRLEEELSK